VSKLIDQILKNHKDQSISLTNDWVKRKGDALRFMRSSGKDLLDIWNEAFFLERLSALKGTL
jgi:hypothetical protein